MRSSSVAVVPPVPAVPIGAQDSSAVARVVAITTWRFLTIGLLAFWQGGFTFYGAVVIHVAHRVLGSHLPVGFITQRVTNWLNLIGGATLILLLVNLWIVRRQSSKAIWWSLAATLVVMTITLIALLALLAMHPMLDRLLDAEAREIIDGTQFRPLHKMYLNVATVQWVAGLVQLWCLMLTMQPRSQSATSNPATTP